jgi:hypothetical protein
MAEWTMARDSKSRVAARQPGVQIPLSPNFSHALTNRGFTPLARKIGVQFFAVTPMGKIPKIAT